MSTTNPSSTKPTQPKLQRFQYVCTNKNGHKVSGEIQSSNMALAKADLRSQGLQLVKIKRKQKSLLEFKTRKRIKPEDLCQFTRHMATMLTAGIPLVQSFDIVAKGVENDSVKDLVNNIKSDVESGSSFSEALQKQPAYFDPLYTNLVGAGEASGSLETMLDRIATYQEKTESLKRKIKKALFYPVAVTVVAIVVTAILLIFVVPQFEELFKGFGAELPAFTQLVINLSGFVQEWWWILVMVFTAAGWVFSYAKKRSPKIQHGLDRIQLKLPVVGNILHKAAIARFARTLSTTFAAGVPLVEALDSVSGASGNIVYSNAINYIKTEVSTGAQMNVAMRNSGIFPNMVIQMVAIGEESGALDNMLAKVATIYEEEVDTAVDGLSSLLEPIIMAVLGVVVGGLVIAMYLPIFKMGSVI